MLADAVRHATEAAPSHAHHLSDLLGRLERAGLPNSALVHVSWAVRQLCEQDGYLIATVQEALLQCYGGEAFALAVDRHSDRFRQRPRSPPSRDASPPPAAPAAVPDARDGCDAAAPTRHGCERRDASAAPAGTLTARQRLLRRRRGARGSGAAAPQPGPPAPEEDHAASISDGADIATAAPPANSAGTSVALTRAAGSWLDGLDLSVEFRNPVPTLQTVPRFLITGVRQALVAALGAIRAAREGRDEAARVRAWKLFLLLPRLLLARSAQIGADGRAAFMRRIELFRQGRVDELHAQSEVEHKQAHPRRRGGDNEEARAAAACAKVRRGQLSRARQMLTAAALAPGNAATLEALTDPARRPPHPLRSPAPEVLQYRPSEEVVLTAHQVGEALRTSQRGSAAGLCGATVELYKLLLDDAEALESFTFAVNVTARAQAPQAALDAIALSRLTALRKPNGGVRGIATGDVFRRLVSRALELDEATRPFQFALQTRAGTDSLAAMLRAVVELDPRATVVSLDGRSAYNTISRATILAKLRDTVPSLLPFTRAMYARTSTYLWWDDEGRVHDIAQAEGVEQGDPSHRDFTCSASTTR